MPNWTQRIQVVQLEYPQTWRLMKGGADGEVEELVVTVSGILSEVGLPPIREKPTATVGQFKFLRQGVVITGLGSPTFEAAVEATFEIYEIFRREFPEGKLEEWAATRYQDYSALPFSNRYVTPLRDAPNMEHIPFEASVDPQGHLESMVAHGFVHGDDNIVEYYTQKASGEEGPTFTKANPQIFRVGDLVDIQVSYIVVPLKSHKFKMLPVLRTIALVDSTFSQVNLAKIGRDNFANIR
ncbi:hypothetical protein BD779DRAFT_1451004 [Infundibulicybe gibba]|nr:hypothetical protein BD779DRAFT_1451004 [Infundibulicybe gibba]